MGKRFRIYLNPGETITINMKKSMLNIRIEDCVLSDKSAQVNAYSNFNELEDNRINDSLTYSNDENQRITRCSTPKDKEKTTQKQSFQSALESYNDGSDFKLLAKRCLLLQHFSFVLFPIYMFQKYFEVTELTNFKIFTFIFQIVLIVSSNNVYSLLDLFVFSLYFFIILTR
ncbi:unnamed protein product [Brachionus calyciflorus]|uniref:Uncharacterized protein n=1 Tax=Brachionus calyciflorus TaxID=104777 RepID=A0A814LT66_9BILA|nr:unnamed protein product [Brachionus calyciflorus]